MTQNPAPSQMTRKLLPRPKGLGPSIRRFFARGLAVVLPTLVTVIILVWAYQLLDNYLAKHVNWLIVTLIAKARGLAFAEVNAIWTDYGLGWVGLVATLLLVLLTGMVVASFVGKGLWRLFEGLLLRVPLIKQIYPHVKQVTDFLLSEQPIDFSRVVLAEYPRKGCWSMGFVVGRSFEELASRVGGGWVTVFIASSPTPVTGYVIQVSRDEVIDLDMSVDQALRFIITCGVVGKHAGGVLPGAAAPGVAAEPAPLPATLAESAGVGGGKPA